MRCFVLVILGIDPGFAIVGYGLVEYKNNSFKPIDYGVIRTDAKELFSDRLKKIDVQLKKIIDMYKPDCCSIEDLFFNTNAKTVIAAAQGRGVCVLCASAKDLPVYEYTPLQVKQAVVGYGRAAKGQVQQMIKIILNLNEIPKPDDAADALAVAICHAHSLLTAKRI